ncbi:uncharacterized protein LOC135690352 [Rhopilema esculentum]|uniref:uncharacterized protein LOC135690352 n=1 Tax=Rhopilema esculentum TaxID=499914 RepID=UPI0031E364F9
METDRRDSAMLSNSDVERAAFNVGQDERKELLSIGHFAQNFDNCEIKKEETEEQFVNDEENVLAFNVGQQERKEIFPINNYAQNADKCEIKKEEAEEQIVKVQVGKNVQELTFTKRIGALKRDICHSFNIKKKSRFVMLNENKKKLSEIRPGMTILLKFLPKKKEHTMKFYSSNGTTFNFYGCSIDNFFMEI